VADGIGQFFARGLRPRRQSAQVIDPLHHADDGKQPDRLCKAKNDSPPFNPMARSHPANRARVAGAARTFDGVVAAALGSGSRRFDLPHAREFLPFRVNRARANWSAHHRSAAESAGFSVPDRASVSFPTASDRAYSKTSAADPGSVAFHPWPSPSRKMRPSPRPQQKLQGQGKRSSID